MLACPADAQSQQDGTGPRTDCDNFLAVQVYAVGGGFIPFGTNSNVTGVDVTIDPSNLLITNQSGGSSSTTPLLGARVHVPLLWNMYDEQRLAFSVFFETGLQSGFASQSFIQTFQNTSFFAGDFGSSTVTEFYQIPLLLGFTVSVAERSASPSLLLDFYGAITLDSWAQILQGAETYFGAVDPHANLAIMARIGIAFGGR